MAGEAGGNNEGEGTELTESVDNVQDDSSEDTVDEDPEGGEEGAM